MSPGYPPYYLGGSAPPPEPPTKHPHRGRRDDEDGEADKENERKERGEERRLLATLAAQVGTCELECDPEDLGDGGFGRQKWPREPAHYIVAPGTGTTVATHGPKELRGS